MGMQALVRQSSHARHIPYHARPRTNDASPHIAERIASTFETADDVTHRDALEQARVQEDYRRHDYGEPPFHSINVNVPTTRNSFNPIAIILTVQSTKTKDTYRHTFFFQVDRKPLLTLPQPM
jgi:hypothetical protein